MTMSLTFNYLSLQSTIIIKMTSFSSIIYIFLVGFISLHSTFGLSLPKRALGYVYKESMSRNAPITLSFYIDNTCPDSQVAYPTMIALVDHFGAQNLKLITHQFPLPYHRNSHTIAKGAHVIDAFSNGTATYPYIKIVFDNISQLTTSATIKCNDEQVLDILAPLAQKVSGISSSQFKQQVNVCFL